MPADDILRRDLDIDGILRRTLNDARRGNALSEAMLTKLGCAFAEAGADPAVRAIILTSIGPAFCAGHDLKEMTAGRASPDRGRAYLSGGAVRLPLPTQQRSEQPLSELYIAAFVLVGCRAVDMLDNLGLGVVHRQTCVRNLVATFALEVSFASGIAFTLVAGADLTVVDAEKLIHRMDHGLDHVLVCRLAKMLRCASDVTVEDVMLVRPDLTDGRVL